MPEYIKCCKNCPDRWIRGSERCHDTCERYLTESNNRKGSKAATVVNNEAYYYKKRLRVDQEDRKAKHNKRRAGSQKYM